MLTIHSLEGAHQASCGSTLWSFLIALVEMPVENCSSKLRTNLTVSTSLLLLIDSLLITSLYGVARPRTTIGLVLIVIHASDGLVDVLLARQDLPKIVNRKLVVTVFCGLMATGRPHHHLTESYVLLLRCDARFLIN